jgi:exoribonuclease II
VGGSLAVERVEVWAKELADALRHGGGQPKARSGAVEFLHHAYIHGGNIADEEKLYLTELLYQLRILVGDKAYAELQVEDCCTPLDDVYQILLELDVIEEHENQALSRSGLVQSYSSHALAQIDSVISRKPAVVTLPATESCRVFTVDDPWSKDLDDAFSVTFGTDTVSVGIHIADVVSAIPFDSPLEHEARRRGSTVYCPDKNFHMFPTVLAESELSLIPNQARECISLLCECGADGSIRSTRFALCTIASEARLTYKEVEAALAGTKHEFSRALNFLHSMMNKLQAERPGAERDSSDQDFKLAYDRDSGEVDSEVLPMASISRQLVAELMVLYNREVADYCFDNEIPILYKTQAALSSEPEESSAQKETSSPVNGLPKRYAPSQWSVHAQPHEAMGFERYTRASSPLRSYVDYLVQLQLINDFKERDLISETTLQQALPSIVEAQKRVRLVQRESRNYWWLEFLLQQGYEGRVLTALHIKRDNKESLFRVQGTELVVSASPCSVELGAVVQLQADALHPISGLASVKVIAVEGAGQQ